MVWEVLGVPPTSYVSVFILFILQETIEVNEFSYGSRGSVYDKVARCLSLSVATVRNWIRDYEALNYIKESFQGKHSKIYSPIIEDLEFRSEFKSFVKENSKIRGEYY